jgi:hypothetical protein
VDAVIFALVDSQLPPERLELEITEGVLLKETEQNREVLRQLQNLGVSIALDDFGVGYPSPIHELDRFLCRPGVIAIMPGLRVNPRSGSYVMCPLEAAVARRELATEHDAASCFAKSRSGNFLNRMNRM